ncbi:TPA: conjugal transfer protein TraI [Escherichia coli]|nr:conjugal transfer protein TraI [Escherichia coli]
MIAHRINRERKASSPARLIKYMVAAKGGIDPTSWERTADYILDSANGTTEGEKVASYRVTNCGTDDPADAAILIQATQAANTRSKAEKTYHFVYSFPPGEQPDLETLHAIEDELCAAIGLDEHQRVSAVHIDTDNLHVHVAINKVHPTGLQNIEPYYDQFRLMEACERLEVEHGLQRTFHGLEAKQRHQNRDIELLPEKAPEQRDSLFREHLRNAYDLSISEPPEAKTLNGLRKLSDTRLQKQSADKAEPVRIGAKVASVEAQSGIETLTGYAARELAPAMRKATSWQELHDAAAEHGLEVRQRGAGLVIGEPDLGIWAKASNVGRDLSMKTLTDRLGLFQPSERQAEAKANRKRYEPRPRRPDNPTTAGLFNQYQRERQAAILARRQGLDQIKRESAAFNAQVRQWSQTERMLLKVAGKGPTKRLMYGTIKQQADASRQKNRQSADARRQALFKQTTMPTWADWLTQQAERGNAEALAVLRDREERIRRWNGELLTADRADKAKAVVLDKLKPKARKDGTMTYSTIDGGMVIDRKTHVQAQKATTGAALVALELASKRFEGQALIVEGTDEFRLEVAQLAGMHGLKVTFTDPAMEQMRRETVEHKEMKKAFQTEVYAPKDTKKGEASEMPGVAPQRRQKQPKDRSNGLI